MIKYEDYLTKCWLLNKSRANTDFIRSSFDYGIRQRRALRGYPVAGVRLVLNMGEVLQFKKFWIALNYGTDKFITDQPIFGDPSYGKTVRFTTAYNLSEIGYLKYELTCQVEILKTNIKKDFLTCPLAPHVGLTPKIGLMPCGS